MAKKPRRLEKAVEEMVERKRKEEDYTEVKQLDGYQPFKLSSGSTLYIDYKRHKALMHIKDNYTGMGGKTLKIKLTNGSTVELVGPFFHPYEEAVELIIASI
jgi:hypothetical protein